MKSFFCYIILFALLVCIPSNLYGQTALGKVKVDNVEFEVYEDGTASTVGCKKEKKGKVTVPKQVSYKGRQYLVTAIGKDSFYHCNAITNVSLPNSIKTIGPDAFFQCFDLKYIEIPSSVTTIGNFAFARCESLSSIIIPNSVTSIGRNAFELCEVLSRVKLPDTLNWIDDELFRNCRMLEEVNIPSTVKNIGKWAFFECNSLREISIPASVKSIGFNAFGGCRSLRIVTIPEGFDLSYIGLKDHNISIERTQPQQNVVAQDASKEIKKEGPKPDPEKQDLPKKEAPKPVVATVDNRSVVDRSIPKRGTIADSNTFAIIIANENYKSLPAAPFAVNDGEVVSKYFTNVLGLPDNHVRLYSDATVGEMAEALNYIEKLSEAYGRDLNLIFYYSGHGVPDDQTGSPLLLPVDGNVSIPLTYFGFDEIVNKFSSLQASNIIVLLDACFSGAGRDDNMLVIQSKGLARSPKTPQPAGNLVVISASKGEERAFANSKEKHGLFTYFLLEKLRESKGEVTLGELFDYVSDKVKRHSIVEQRVMQSPTVNVSPSLANTWRSLPLRKK